MRSFILLNCPSSMETRLLAVFDLWEWRTTKKDGLFDMEFGIRDSGFGIRDSEIGWRLVKAGKKKEDTAVSSRIFRVR